MTLKLIQIGNSKGLRLPKNIIEKYGLEGELTLIETENGLLIKPVDKPRSNWKAKILAEGNDNLIGNDDVLATEFDDTEWTW